MASRLESAIKMQQVTNSMSSVVKGMDKVLGGMNVEQISKVRVAARASPHVHNTTLDAQC